jgi:hypothetical protein
MKDILTVKIKIFKNVLEIQSSANEFKVFGSTVKKKWLVSEIRTL